LVLFGAVLLSLAGSAWTDSLAAMAGCASNVYHDIKGKFNDSDFDLVNTNIDENGYLSLNTGQQTIDPNKIVLPYTQEVSVTFFYKDPGFIVSDFGWMLADKGIAGLEYEVYQNLNDDNEDGVLDLGVDDQSAAYGDANGDGIIDARDNRQVLGTFAGGSELVFYLKVGNLNQRYFTKQAWNTDIYHSTSGECDGNNFTKTFHLGRPLLAETSCTLDSNWMPTYAFNRLNSLFGLGFDDNDEISLIIERDKSFAHAVIGAPGNKPNEWVLGWEDFRGGGDADYNDIIFQIEREAGGSARLKSSKAITIEDKQAYFTSVTLKTYDQMPCGGKTNITYYLSIDNGVNWLEIGGWDTAYSFTIEEDGTKTIGDEISNWTPGGPEFAYRTRHVDIAGRGLSGNELIWKAEFTSQGENCDPRVINLGLDARAATNVTFSRSSPVVIANMIYSGSSETPAASWDDQVMRGHLEATQLYDPRNPNITATTKIWDAGEQLSQKSPDARNIKFPKIAVSRISNEEKDRGNNAKNIFSGTLNNHPLVATSITISDQTETFYDIHNNVLEGNLGGTGTINRFTGEFRVRFNTAPNQNQPITASYHYYTTQPQLMDFNTANVTNAMLGLNDTYIIPKGYIHDFNEDGILDAADGNWLVNWVRGYKDGSSIAKEWLLGSVDHSVPAGATPPGQPAWLFGTAIPPAERNSYEAFQNSKTARQTVIYVGARDGMLHAFDAGKFRHGDNPDSILIKELRGFFKGEDRSEDCPDFCSDNCDECPDYGTGEELWAFIPANLIARLKNNLRQADDQAYVDASPALADVFIGGQWKTVLLSAEGNGGDTVFCLDVTDPLDPKYLWEFADPHLFRSRFSPSVAQIGRIADNGTTKWVAFLVSGKTYNTTLYPSLYMINMADGSMIRRIFLNADAGGVEGVPSGQPTILDSDGNGYIDRIYMGSDKGRLYKINLPDDPHIKQYEINHCVINNDFSDDESNEIDEDQRWHPIYGSPVAIVENALNTLGKVAYNIRIFFGTGDSPYYDGDIDTGNTNYHFFAYRDQDQKGQCDQNFVHLDWFLELEAGERIFASAFAAAGNVYFGTTTAETEDPCAGSGDNQPTVNGGGLYALSFEGNLLLDQEVGNVTTAPLVVDQHIYVKSQSMGLRSFGGGPYNNPTIMGGSPQFRMRNWRELF
jgi:hypothetical protein